MRVMFTTLPFKAHLYPRVPLAWALRAAGHEVCVVSQPELTEEVMATGLTALTVGRSLDQADRMAEIQAQQDDAEAATGGDGPDFGMFLRMDETRPEVLTDDFLQGLFTVMTTDVFRNLSAVSMVDDLVGAARRWRPDLIVWDPLSFAGAIAARACGAAHARMMYGLDLIGHMRERYLAALDRRPAPLREDPFEEWLSPVLERYGCTFSEDLVIGQWTVDPGPGWMRLPVDAPVVPVRPVSYNGRAVFPDWLREPPKRPRVCLTLGLSHREVLGGNRLTVSGLLDAVADLDVEMIATLTAEQLAGATVPDNVRAVDFVPINELLPSCAAVVHQGGTGTAQTALTHGVPQVLLPGELWDTRLKARRITEAGVALHAEDPASLSPADLRAMLLRVLEEPSFREAAARRQAELLAMPAPRDVVPVLEELTARHRGGGER